MRLGVEAALVDGALVPGDVEVADGLIVAYGLAGANGRGVAVPGLVDLQVNGFGGVDLMGADADGYRRAGEALLETGVTSYLPTFISAPEEDLVAALRAVPVIAEGPRILGVHLEGPFLAPSRRGARPGRRDCPDHPGRRAPRARDGADRLARRDRAPRARHGRVRGRRNRDERWLLQPGQPRGDAPRRRRPRPGRRARRQHPHDGRRGAEPACARRSAGAG